MKYIFLILSVSTVLACSITSAQYPGEDCRWECEVIYCDYYYDYCDYDCHEVCYPYRSQDQPASAKPTLNRWLSVQQSSSKTNIQPQVKVQPTKSDYLTSESEQSCEDEDPESIFPNDAWWRDCRYKRVAASGSSYLPKLLVRQELKAAQKRRKIGQQM